jgi:hypothetical protein
VKAYGSKSDNDVKAAMKNIPEGLTWAFNLGHADVFPATSGKCNAAVYLMQKFDAAPSSSFLLCDDDNDLGRLPGLSPLPCCSDPLLAMRAAVARLPMTYWGMQQGMRSQEVNTQICHSIPVQS